MPLDFDPKALVASAAAHGLCSAPKFTPPFTDDQIAGPRRRGVRLSEPLDPVTGLAAVAAKKLREFISNQTGEFTINDFEFASGYMHFTARTYLIAALKAGLIERLPGHQTRYKTISGGGKTVRVLNQPKEQLRPTVSAATAPAGKSLK
jgi:hypothetical protein